MPNKGSKPSLRDKKRALQKKRTPQPTTLVKVLNKKVGVLNSNVEDMNLILIDMDITIQKWKPFMEQWMKDCPLPEEKEEEKDGDTKPKK